VCVCVCACFCIFFVCFCVYACVLTFLSVFAAQKSKIRGDGLYNSRQGIIVKVGIFGTCCAVCIFLCVC
jgi:hypothetical protein